MSERDLPPLSPFASTLIAADCRRPGPPPELRAPALPLVKPPVVRRFSLAAAAALVGRLSLAAKVATAAVLVSGAVATSATIPWRRLGAPARKEHEAHPARPPVARKAAHLAISPLATPAPPMQASAPVPALPSPAPARSADGGRAPVARTASRERQLLDDARAALAAREGVAATRALVTHARLYPHGDLVEERAALEVAAAVVRSDGTLAIARAAEFHRRYPGSIFGVAVDRALASIR